MTINVYDVQFSYTQQRANAMTRSTYRTNGRRTIVTDRGIPGVLAAVEALNHDDLNIWSIQHRGGHDVVIDVQG